MALLSRGYAPQGVAAMFEFVRMQSNLRATLTLFSRGEKAFRVTAKKGNEERRRIRAPGTLWTLIGISGIALAWFGLTVAGLTPLTYQVPWTAYGAAFWVGVNLGFLVTARRRIRCDRFASERRTAIRFQIGAPTSVEDRAGRLLDVSMSGALVPCASPLERRHDPLRIEFHCAGNEIVLLGEERGRQTLADGSALIRLQFVDHQAPQLARLATSLFGSTDSGQNQDLRTLAAVS